MSTNERDIAQLNDLLYSLPIQLYLVDSFTFAASATSAAAVSFFFFLIFYLIIDLNYPPSSSSDHSWALRSHYLANKCLMHLGSEVEIPYASFFSFTCSTFSLNRGAHSCWQVWLLFLASLSLSGSITKERKCVLEIL